jgi:hypothetical protein
MITYLDMPRFASLTPQQAERFVRLWVSTFRMTTLTMTMSSNISATCERELPGLVALGYGTNRIPAAKCIMEHGIHQSLPITPKVAYVDRLAMQIKRWRPST